MAQERREIKGLKLCVLLSGLTGETGQKKKEFGLEKNRNIIQYTGNRDRLNSLSLYQHSLREDGLHSSPFSRSLNKFNSHNFNPSSQLEVYGGQ
jgi:hypothetical protein